MHVDIGNCIIFLAWLTAYSILQCTPYSYCLLSVHTTLIPHTCWYPLVPGTTYVYTSTSLISFNGSHSGHSELSLVASVAEQVLNIGLQATRLGPGTLRRTYMVSVRPRDYFLGLSLRKIHTYPGSQLFYILV